MDLYKLDEFLRDDDSTIFVKERQRNGKLTGLFKRRRGKITGETKHTLTFNHEKKDQETVLSEREIAIERTPRERKERTGSKRHRNEPNTTRSRRLKKKPE